MTRQLAFPKMEIKVLHSLILEVTYCPLYYVGHTAHPWYKVGGHPRKKN